MTDERKTTPEDAELRIREAIGSMGDVRPDPAFRERLKREFSRGTIPAPAAGGGTREARRPTRWPWVLLPAAAVALVFVLFLPKPAPVWTLQAVRGQGQVEIDGRTLAADAPAHLARAVRLGGRIRIEEGILLDLMLEDSLLLELDEGADVSVPTLPGPESRAPLITEVHAGEMRVKTGPGFSGGELRIHTTESRTEIVGTTVSVYKGDGLTCVCVLEGTARIGADESRLEAIPQGMRKVMFSDGRPSMVTEIQPQHAAGLRDFEHRFQGVFEPDLQFPGH